MTPLAPAPIRSISTIAREIRRNWKPIYFGAVPYLEAMEDLESINSKYGADDGKSIVRYFLSNASKWRGPVARAIKAELNGMLKT